MNKNTNPIIKLPSWMRQGHYKKHSWGFDDTEFVVDDNKVVTITGDRYDISGKKLPELMRFIEEAVCAKLEKSNRLNKSLREKLDPPNINKNIILEIENNLGVDFISVDNEARISHAHGYNTVSEIFKLHYTQLPIRLPDIVAYPSREEEVIKLIEIAKKFNLCLIPYGGGTNVTRALEIPQDETRAVVSVDMKRMNHVLEIQPENFIAHVEAGITGLQLELELRKHGLTCGHEPDSIEFSTLGGWIATKASGMRRAHYGNIEDIVLGINCITPMGKLFIKQSALPPRTSLGVSPEYMLFGSEGNFGIITSCYIKLRKIPPCVVYGSLVFPHFDIGTQFLKELKTTSRVLPSSIRLVNNKEFRFGQAFKPKPSFLHKLLSKFNKFILFSIKKFKPDLVVAAVYVLEGTQDEVLLAKKAIKNLSKKHHAVAGGSANGKAGYNLTFAIAYIGEFLNQFNIIGETLETSVPWDKIHNVCYNTETVFRSLLKEKGIPGGYLGFRITQLYDSGVCIYFTCGYHAGNSKDPIGDYEYVERKLRESILKEGGSLSHHHCIGKLRQDFLLNLYPSNVLNVLKSYKNSVDPSNIFGARNNFAKTVK